MPFLHLAPRYLKTFLFRPIDVGKGTHRCQGNRQGAARQLFPPPGKQNLKNEYLD